MFLQAYEITVDADNVSWRNSSLRVRFYDPAQGYKISRALILRSERDRLSGRVIRPHAAPPSCAPAVKRHADADAAGAPGAKRSAAAGEGGAELPTASVGTSPDLVPAAQPLQQRPSSAISGVASPGQPCA